MTFKQWIKENRPYTNRNLNAVGWEYVEECMEKAYNAGFVQANINALNLLDELEKQAETTQ